MNKFLLAKWVLLIVLCLLHVGLYYATREVMWLNGVWIMIIGSRLLSGRMRT